MNYSFPSYNLGYDSKQKRKEKTFYWKYVPNLK